MKELPAIEGGKLTRNKDDIVIFGQPSLNNEDIQSVVEVLSGKNKWLSTGPKTAEFEEKFAQYQQVKHALGTNSCSSALILSLLSLDLPENSEVITTNMTFCATVNSIIHAKMKPVIVDCKPDCNIAPKKVEQAITPKTKAIVAVHLYGQPADMDELLGTVTNRVLALAGFDINLFKWGEK